MPTLTLPYRVDRALNHSLRSMGSRERTITREGLRFRVHRLTVDEEFVKNIIERREYLSTELHIQPTDTVIDIGANIGCFSVQAARLAAQVIAVEPEPDNLRLLRTNLRFNRCANVTVVPMALTAHGGEATLHRAAEGGFHTLLANRGATGETVLVPAITMSDLFATHQISHCHFLKIDCEGAEFAFLPTWPDDIWARIDGIAMEYHTPRTGDGDVAIQRLLALVESRGFQVMHVTRFPPPFQGGHLFARR